MKDASWKHWGDQDGQTRVASQFDSTIEADVEMLCQSERKSDRIPNQLSQDCGNGLIELNHGWAKALI